ncbi:MULTISPECIES: transcriptional regulator CynR [Caldilinea]|jgi:LysR family cyn operon transcriptional activator|uniref:Putative transcriptional regulator n=1 Tax=Caldilinea aerophila (strain DSM 14535 / JCM 11387 / NBRC 104270 / STL-6-O1) TaxID=926550 RepID=I0I696_CALAS|nr:MULTISPECIES: transcriptional regulator CynR [Caldilinea]MBO9393428.1 transcriptional regulator CynR [Caldilinea sp.]BAM00784.1 putative transcriptional regulator [Caldilinea aerophila DSM 14535 = NBRC 104270]GIV72125.1 MAG: LysR family transcriptional regulator [Caldilinea sp.]
MVYPELRQLRYLLAVTEAENFTRAAEKMFVSQPALSQQIQQLEELLGATLLDRQGRSVRLTAEGEVVVRAARRIFAQLEQMETELQELSGLRRGALALGVVQTVNAYLMPTVVADFACRYPGIHLRVEECPQEQIEEGLACGRYQVGIGFQPTSREVEMEPLFTEALALIAPRHHPLTIHRTIPLSEAARWPMALLTESLCTRRLLNDCMAQVGARPHVVAEFNTIAAVLAAVQRLGLATVLPRPVLDAVGEGELCSVALQEPTPQRMVGLLYRSKGYRCRATLAFAEAVRKATEREDFAIIPL